MREIRPSGSEGGVALTPPSLPLSVAVHGGTPQLRSLPHADTWKNRSQLRLCALGIRPAVL